MELLSDGPAKAKHVLVLAHGAGGAMDTPFLNTMAGEVASRGIRVVRFEFPYMAARRNGKRTGGPDREPVLIETWKNVVKTLGGGNALVIGGKSLGGRIATMIADEVGARGVVCLGYPFHPPSDPARLRTKHLRDLRTPALIIQGERDPFGARNEVTTYRLSPSIRIEWLPDGDHSFKPRVRSGETHDGYLRHAAEVAAEFITRLP